MPTWLLTRDRQEPYSILFFMVFISYLTLIFSPFISFLMSTITIFFFKKKIVRFILYPALILSIAIITSSRDIFTLNQDDFETYYDFYIQIHNNNESYYGFEIGFRIITYILSFLFGIIPPRFLLLIYATIQIILSFLLFELWIKKEKKQDEANKILFLFIIFIPFTTFSLVIRQSISIIILLFYFVIKKSTFRISILIIATSIHLTALPIFLFIIFAKKMSANNWKMINLKNLIFIPIIILIVISLNQQDKIRAFFTGRVEFDLLAWIYYFKILIISLIISLVSINRWNLILTKFISIILIYGVTLDIIAPAISFRIMLPFVLFSGVILYYVKVQPKTSFMTLISNILILFLIISKLVSMIYNVSYFSTFRSFPPVDIVPFYYIENIFENIPSRHR